MLLVAGRSSRNYALPTHPTSIRLASTMCASTRYVNLPNPRTPTPPRDVLSCFRVARGGIHAMLQISPTPTTGVGSKECWPKNKRPHCLRCKRTPHAITFFEIRSLNKKIAMLLSSISLRSELQASSDEELSCEFELNLSAVDRYRFGRFADCLIWLEGLRGPALQSAQVTMCEYIPARMQRSTSPLT